MESHRAAARLLTVQHPIVRTRIARCNSQILPCLPEFAAARGEAIVITAPMCYRLIQSVNRIFAAVHR